MELLKLLSANEIVAQTISFLLLLAILRAVFWKKMLAMLDGRKGRIAADLKAAADLRAASEDVRAGYEKRLAEIDEAARQRMQAAIAEGRRIAEEIRDTAAKDGEKIVENARSTLASDIAKAREGLKNEMVDLVIDVAGKVVQEKLSEKEDKQIVDFFLKELEKR